MRDVLAPEMAHKEVYLHATLIGKPGHKGGNIRFDRATNDIGHFLKQRPDTYVSTMFDFFRVDKDWPGRGVIRKKIQTGTTLSASEKAGILEERTREKIIELFSDYHPKRRFVPYIEMHEFEAILFSDADILAQKIGVEVSQINKIIEPCENPEEINDDPENVPSKRLEALDRNYRKVTMGKIIAESIGIPIIREQCPHFNDWLTKLENLKHGANGRNTHGE